MTFLNAALLTGTVAGSIPIIIHLFHKSRFKVVKWGAMHLLEAVLRTNQKRVKIEQWILLAIRTLIPILLALAMARPLWTGASKLLGDARSSTVVLLDNSYSMEASRSGTTNWSIARDETQRLLGDLRNGSDAYVMLMGQGGGGVLDTPTVDLSRVSQVLAKTNAGYGTARVPAALDFAASTLEKMREPVRQVVMITDFQRVSFEATEDKLLGASIDRLKKQSIPPGITFWDVGQEVKENVAIESLDFSRLMVGVGQKIQIRVNLRNYGDANHPDLRVMLKVDGKDKTASQVNLGPQAKAQVLFTQAFDSAGSHTVEVSTEPDALAADNTFLASIPVRDRLPVLLVDGAPGATPDDMKSETAYLQIALSPFAAGKVELSDLIAARTMPAEALNAKALAETQVVVMANIRKLTDEQLRALEEFVKNGGGPGKVSKFDYATRLAACLSYLMLQQADGVGLVTFDTKIQRYIPVRSRVSHLKVIIDELQASKPGAETELGDVFHDLVPKLHRRGLLIIISDCFGEVSNFLKALAHFRHARHEILVFQIWDRDELEFPFKGWTQFDCLERDGVKHLLDPALLRQAYLENLRVFRDDLTKGCRRHNVDLVSFCTDEPYANALAAYLSRRLARG